MLLIQLKNGFGFIYPPVETVRPYGRDAPRREKMPVFEVNDSHRKRLVFRLIHCRNDWLAASDLFHMFTQSIKFYTFHYQYRCLKNVIRQIDSKNGWLLLSGSLRQNLG